MLGFNTGFPFHFLFHTPSRWDQPTGKCAYSGNFHINDDDDGNVMRRLGMDAVRQRGTNLQRKKLSQPDSSGCSFPPESWELLPPPPCLTHYISLQWWEGEVRNTFIYARKSANIVGIIILFMGYFSMGKFQGLLFNGQILEKD